MKNPFKDKFITNFHHADFDGAISGACAKAAFGENGTYQAAAIGKVSKMTKSIIKDSELILLTDIGIDKDHIDELFPYIKSNKIIIYDHHLNEKTLDLFEKLGSSTFSVLEDEVCGATLTWYKLSEYFPNNQKLKDLEEIVYFSDVYDMWRLDNKDFEYATKLNDLIDYQIGYNPDQFRERWLENPDPHKLSSKEIKIIDIKAKRAERNLKELEENAILFEYKNKTFVFSESDATDVTKMHFMNAVVEGSENVDMFIFKYKHTTQCSVRALESSGIDDINDWFEDFGCMGHAKAGGIPKTEYHRLAKVLSNL